MTTHNIPLDPGKVTLKGEAIMGIVERSAESWQFFAFMFAAVLTLFFGVLDDILTLIFKVVSIEVEAARRITVKVFLFFVVGYLTLWNRRCRNAQVRLLSRFKKEIY